MALGFGKRKREREATASARPASKQEPDTHPPSTEGRPLVGSHINDVIQKAQDAGGWDVDTTSEKYVDFFSQRDYPFRVDLGADGIITSVSRPPELMKRYDDFIEANSPPMRWDDVDGWVEETDGLEIG